MSRVHPPIYKHNSAISYGSRSPEKTIKTKLRNELTFVTTKPTTTQKPRWVLKAVRQETQHYTKSYKKYFTEATDDSNAEINEFSYALI